MVKRVLISSFSLFDLARIKKDFLFFDSIEFDTLLYKRTSDIIIGALKEHYDVSSVENAYCSV